MVFPQGSLLPIVRYKEEIVETVKRNRVTIIVGETGSGKTTQVPLYLLKAGFGKHKRIGVTQPRRIAAISVAQYVAGQFGCAVGEEVGYQIRFDDTTTEGTRIKFMTDGILLQETKSDPNFSRYEVLLIDEAHERGLNTDFCLGFAKRALAENPDLKVVIMSATIDADKFSAFFGGAPILNVEGRMYPVEIRYITAEDREAARKFCSKHFGEYSPGAAKEIAAFAALTVKNIHTREPEGDVLVFMPRKEEIGYTMDILQGFKKDAACRNLHLLEVHGDMNPEDQRRIFDRFPGRKVVVATNIAETSVTIPGVVYVVDSAIINQTNFDPRSGIGSLEVVEHSKAGLEQRKGRAGRTQAGVCIRLFAEEEYEKGRWQYRRGFFSDEGRPEFTKPEIQRSDLAGVVLRMVGLGIEDTEHFDFVDEPSILTIGRAYRTLKAIGALTEDNKITDVGQLLLDLPVEPRIARMILAAEEYGCTDEIATIAGALSARNIFLRPKDKEAEADVAKEAFLDKRSDFLTALNAMTSYVENDRDRDWAKAHFLNWRALDEILNIRRQLLEILRRIGITASSIGYTKPKDELDLTEEEKAQAEAVGKAVTAGLLENIALFSGSFRVGYKRDDDRFFIHPGSAVFSASPPIITCAEVVETTKPYARNCQTVEAEWLKELAPHLVTVETSEPEYDYLRGQFFVRTTTLFKGMRIAEEEVPAPKNAELTRKLAKDLAWGRTGHPSVSHNRRVLTELEQLHRASEGKIRDFTHTDLEEFYVERLAGATSMAEAEGKDLFLRLEDYVSKEDQERYRQVPPPEERETVFDVAARRAFPAKPPPRDEEATEEALREIDQLKKSLEPMLDDPESYGFSAGVRGRLDVRHLEQRLSRASFALRYGSSEIDPDEAIQTVRSAVESHQELRERKRQRDLKRQAQNEEDVQEAARRAEEEAAWHAYEQEVVELKARCVRWPGFDTYSFPVDESGEPQDFEESSGIRYRFDWDHSEVLPEAGKSYFGFITQQGRPALVALLLEVRKKPRNIE